MRIPHETYPLGVGYYPQLVNILSHGIRPVHDLAMIWHVESTLKKLREDTLKRSDQKVSDDLKEPPGNENASKDTVPLFRPVHMTGFGRLGVTSIFTSPDLPTTYYTDAELHGLFSELVVGVVPYPNKSIASILPPKKGGKVFNWLKQEEPENFLPLYDHFKLIQLDEEYADNPDARDAMAMPVFVISEIQISGVLNTIHGASLVLPIMMLMDEIIDGVMRKHPGSTGGNLSALLVDTLGWNDFALLIRTDHPQLALSVIFEIANLSIADVLKKRDELVASAAQDSPLSRSLQHEKEALENRTRRIMARIEACEKQFDPDNTPEEVENRVQGRFEKVYQEIHVRDLSNHVFSRTISTLNLLWPFADHGFEYQHAILRYAEAKDEKGRETEKRQIQEKRGWYEKWNIRGDLEASVYMAVKPGNGAYVQDTILNYLKLMELDKGREKYLKEPAGYFDFLLEGKALQGRPVFLLDECDDELFRETASRVCLLRWMLLGGPREEFVFDTVVLRNKAWKEGANPNYELIKKGFQRCGVTEFSIELHVPCRTFKPYLLIQHHINEDLMRAIDSRLAEEGEKRMFLSLFGENRIGTSIQDSLHEVLRSWRQELGDLTNSSRIFELAHPVQAWREMCKTVLTEIYGIPAELRDSIEPDYQVKLRELILYFAQSFDEAILQRALPAFARRETPNLVVKFQVALSRIMTVHDGLMKAMLSLLSAPGAERHGAVTLIDFTLAAVVETRGFYPPKRRDPASYSVVKIHIRHLQNPFNISTLVHEMLHVVFRAEIIPQYLRPTSKFSELSNCFDYPVMDTGEALWAEAVREMAIEYFVAWLLFQDSPHIYTWCRLLSSVFLPDYSSPKKDVVEMFAARSYATSFVVELQLRRVWRNEGPLTIADDSWKDDFEPWWKENCSVLLPLVDTREVMKTLVFKWIEEYQRVKVWTLLGQISELAENFFSGIKGDKADGPDFATGLRQAEGIVDEALKWRRDSLERSKTLARNSMCPKIGENFSGQSIHCLFTPHCTGEELSDAARYREVLLGYCVIMRAYYTQAYEWISPAAARSKRIHYTELPETDHLVDLDRYHDTVLDVRGGRLMPITRDAREKWFSLDIAMIESLWHLAEIAKLSLVYNVLKKPIKDPKATIEFIKGPDANR